jgi:hypothetical protein
MNSFRNSDDDDDTDDDYDYEDDGSSDDGDEEPTVPCPFCGLEMLEDSPRCPSCGQYISAEDSPGPTKPLWVIATAIVCLGIALWWVFL